MVQKAHSKKTLNIIETFGTYSDFKMNKDKSELIWLGRTKHTKEILCKNSTLSWGKTDFKLLGIKKVSQVINLWKKRILTPIGKITVLKTIILSKFIHLFQSLPPPSDHLVKQITKIMCVLIWDGKPDTISRTTLVQDKENVGMEMLDLVSFINGLQINWGRRLLRNHNPMWKKANTNSIPSTEKLLCFGAQWPMKIPGQTEKSFLERYLEYMG